MIGGVQDDTAPDALLAAAHAARGQAYAPYSRFAVGAALRDEHGRVHVGCNVENAAYPQGQCAEAGAIAALVVAGGRRIVEAVVAGPAGAHIVPCGGCRQRLREFMADDAPLWLADEGRSARRTTLGALLPDSFGPDHLERSNAGPGDAMPHAGDRSAA